MNDQDQRQQTTDVVRSFFAALEQFDIDAFVDLWAENGTQVMPFSPEGFPDRLEGKEAIRRQYGGMPEAFKSMSFDVDLHPALDPHVLVAEYRGTIELASGGDYNNAYCGVFEVRDRLVSRFVEYFDPIVLQRAFGGSIGETFSVEGE